MKKVYLIHGWGGSSKGGWFGWLKKELGKREIKVLALDMPDTDNPKIESWVGYLEDQAKESDEETYFVGHSVGCQTILRYLERLPGESRVGGAVFVAGWFNLKEEAFEEEGDKEIARPWQETPLDFDRIKKHTNNFLAIFSDDDPFVPVTDSDLFKERLTAKVIIKKSQEHFNEVKEIKEVLNFIVEENLERETNV